ncbi:cytochrome c3 family protein [Singulisphaera rosea]
MRLARRPIPAVLVLVLVSAGLSWAVWPRGEALKPESTRVAVEAGSRVYENTQAGVAYVGDAVCSRCHAGLAKTYHQHPMGRSMSPAAEVEPKSVGQVLDVDDLRYSIERRDGRVFHREERRDSAGRVLQTTEAEVQYALGSGTHGIAFLLERGGKMYQSPLSWYSETRRWDLAPGYRGKNYHFDRLVTSECLYCHADRVVESPGQPLIFLGLSIGCERCHGPGERHANRREFVSHDDPTIVNPADLSPPLREAVCEQCHHQGGRRVNRPGRSPFDYRPGLAFDEFVSVSSSAGDPLSRKNAVGQVEQMRESRCYQKSNSRLGCLSCHDPHRLPDAGEKVAFYRGRCLECHEKRGCSLPKPERLSLNPLDDCVSCHMPKSTVVDVAHTSRTLHNIPKIPTETPTLKGLP